MSIQVLLIKTYMDQPAGTVLHVPVSRAEELVYDLKFAKFIDLPSYPANKVVHPDFIYQEKAKTIETSEARPHRETSDVKVKRGRGRPKKVRTAKAPKEQ